MCAYIRHIALLIAITLSTIASPTRVNAQATAKREMRGVWVATVWGIDWPSRQGTTKAVTAAQQRELADMLDRCKAMNLTTVCFQARGMADVMFRSNLEPWSSFVSGKRGLDPGWDPLEWVVNECHKRGLECYAWVNPFRWSSGTAYDTPFDRNRKRDGWLLTHGKYTVLNPGMEEVRDHVKNVCREIVEDYDIDGLIFDDYFYPNRIPEGPGSPDYQLYLSQAPWMTHGDWRRANIHKAIADIRSMIADRKPWVRFGISPAGVAGKDEKAARKWGAEAVYVKADDWQYGEIYSDPLGLMYEGTIDFISPQIYWPTTHATAPYEPLAQWWSRTANLYGRHLYPSVTLERIGKGSLAEHRRELGKQIAHNRRHSVDGCQGTIIYSAKYLPKVADMLQDDHYLYPSLTPGIATPHDIPAPPSRLKLAKGGILTWEAPASGARRYTVYAVPTEVSRRDAMDENGDGIDGAFLIGVTYEPRFSVGSDEGFRYAVCSYSGYSTESPPAWLD